MFNPRRKLQEKREALRSTLDRLPALGDSAKVYPVTLTEPEINAIHAAFGYLRSNCIEMSKIEPSIMKWWNHYGPTLEALSERLGEFDD